MGSREEGGGAGCGLIPVVGAALAAVCSWVLNQSVGWAIIHAFFGWAYLLYLCAGFGGGLPPEVF